MEDSPVVLFPMDEAADELIGGLIDDPPEARAEIVRRTLDADARIHIAVGRAWKRYDAQLADIDRQVEAFMADVDVTRERIRRRAQEAEAFLADVARLNREAGRGTFIDIPGFGRVSTRRRSERFAIDAPVVLHALTGDDLQMFSAFRDPRPPERVLKTDVLRGHLEELLDSARATVTTVDDEAERARLDQAAGEKIAALFPGVEYIPEGFSVTYDIHR